MGNTLAPVSATSLNFNEDWVERAYVISSRPHCNIILPLNQF